MKLKKFTEITKELITKLNENQIEESGEVIRSILEVHKAYEDEIFQILNELSFPNTSAFSLLLAFMGLRSNLHSADLMLRAKEVLNKEFIEVEAVVNRFSFRDKEFTNDVHDFADVLIKADHAVKRLMERIDKHK
jgi:hypothetical protein